VKLPRFQHAVVPKAKLLGYLLSPTHEDGRTKADWLARFGFTPANWKILAESLKRRAHEYDVENIEDSL
jgi:hypothetical protein